MLNFSLLRIPEFFQRLVISHRLGCKYLVYAKGRCTIIGENFIHVGSSFCMDRDIKIEAWKKDYLNNDPEISIGDRVFINSRTHISSIQKIEIGNDVLIGSDVLINDNNHGKCFKREDLVLSPINRELFSKGPIFIGDGVWIGDKVVILGGVTIGKGAIIGAGAIVTKDIPEYSVAVGNPAKVIRSL